MSENYSDDNEFVEEEINNGDRDSNKPYLDNNQTAEIEDDVPVSPT